MTDMLLRALSQPARALPALLLLAAACAPTAPAPPPTTAPTTAPAVKPTEAAAKPTAAAAVATAPATTSPPAAAASPAASPAAVPAASPAARPAASPAASPAAAPAAGSGIAQVQPLSPRARLKIAIQPMGVSNLPFLLAIDKGYFARAGLDVEAIPMRSSQDQPVQLARGDLDIGFLTPNPALYGQATEGFDVKLILAYSAEKQGRVSLAWLNVIKDKAGEIKELKDLKGRTVEGARKGSPPAMMVTEALRLAGLEAGRDVTVTYRANTLQDLIVIAQNKAADVIGISEPTASTAENQGLVVRWKSAAELVPWYQAALTGVSPKTLETNRAAVVKLLEVLVVTMREINAANGVWTPELLNTATKWSELPAKVITDQGGAPYFPPNGIVNVDSLARAQDIYVAEGELKQKTDVNKLVEASVLQEALQRVGRVPE